MGGGRKRNAFGGPGASLWVCFSFTSAPHRLACLCRRDGFPCLEVAGFFFRFVFFLSKGHCAQDALFLAACQWCEGRRLAAFGCAADSHHRSQLAFAGQSFPSPLQ